jgi:hypothetical protein
MGRGGRGKEGVGQGIAEGVCVGNRPMGGQVGETGLFGETGPLIAELRQPHHPVTMPTPPPRASYRPRTPGGCGRD